jgi:cyclohexanecarboxylate-CoA ligase
VVEVEQLLYPHPPTHAAAVVAMPDARLGERGCAFVTLRAGHSLDFAAMIDYLTTCRMMKQYLPERLEIIDAFPRTPSGKIQKFKLREQARSLTPMSLVP